MNIRFYINGTDIKIAKCSVILKFEKSVMDIVCVRALPVNSKLTEHYTNFLIAFEEQPFATSQYIKEEMQKVVHYLFVLMHILL